MAEEEQEERDGEKQRRMDIETNDEGGGRQREAAER